MERRFLSLWFAHLSTDWFALKQPHLRALPFVLSAHAQGRVIITAANAIAEMQGICAGLSVADARAMLPTLIVLDDRPTLRAQLLQRIGEWCIRFTPFAAVDGQDGLMLEVTGCAHLWGGEERYLADVLRRLAARGYGASGALADTIGSAWGQARFGKTGSIVSPGKQTNALSQLPAAALRLDAEMLDRLNKLGLHQVKDFISMPRSALRRRFGALILQRLAQALGEEEEMIQPIQPPQPYSERLPCPEPIVTLTGIEIALERMLETLCGRLRQEGKGIRVAVFRAYRVDGSAQGLQVGTARASYNVVHLFYLFRIKLSIIEPALGIELFMLEAPHVEDHGPAQSSMWDAMGGLGDSGLSELLDRLAMKMGEASIKRFLPGEHYWPERSLKPASSIAEEPEHPWQAPRPRPLQLLTNPEQVEVTAPIPDYPPMLFRYKGKVHKIVRADGPERIEPEWWIQDGEHRDYYSVEDEEGCRYWLFRSGHYDTEKKPKWYLHGFFA